MGSYIFLLSIILHLEGKAEVSFQHFLWMALTTCLISLTCTDVTNTLVQTRITSTVNAVLSFLGTLYTIRVTNNKRVCNMIRTRGFAPFIGFTDSLSFWAFIATSAQHTLNVWHKLSSSFTEMFKKITFPSRWRIVDNRNNLCSVLNSKGHGYSIGIIENTNSVVFSHSSGVRYSHCT